MNAIEKIIVIVAGILINATIAAILPAVVYAMIRYPLFAQWVKEGIEDSDGKLHKQDVKDMVLLFWASICVWLLIIIAFVWLIFERDLQILFLCVLGAATTFFGISKIGAK
jgi:hypothetical protein